jgi:hypothetical protein
MIQFGSLTSVVTMTYPDDCVQSLHESWWVEDPSGPLCRGRLVWAPAINVDQVPFELLPEAREDARDHTRAKATVRQYHVSRARPARPPLPVAGLPLHRGEAYFAYKAKRRPALILGTQPPDVSKLLAGSPKSHSRSPITIAPYYGATQSGGRSGYPPEFVQRVRRIEYPQYVWDRLPIAWDETDSLLRLDHMQPIGQSASTCEKTKWRLSDEALEIMSAWVTWLMEGSPPATSLLASLREDFVALDD